MEGHRESVSMLIKNGARLDIKDLQGFTPLHLAAYRGQTECIELLLGTDRSLVNTKSDCGWTALFVASSRGHNKAVSMLIKNGADLEVKDID